MDVENIRIKFFLLALKHSTLKSRREALEEYQLVDFLLLMGRNTNSTEETTDGAKYLHIYLIDRFGAYSKLSSVELLFSKSDLWMAVFSFII